MKVQPVFLIRPKTMSQRDIRRAQKHANICIVECSEPERTRFLEPPLTPDLDAQARAALALVRHIVINTTNFSTTFYGAHLVRWFVDQLLTQPTPARVERTESVKSARTREEKQQ